jgi:ring-1,2-phenylacetyl-CoA epoxidase subunit PaaB
MTDTQWPRYIVFQQAKTGEPYQYAGSVHAPDAEMALMNARDVFVRRPACVSLWIVPANFIFAVTKEQLALNPDLLKHPRSVDAEPQTYDFFQKLSHKGTYVDVDSAAQATSPEAALQTGLQWFLQSDAVAWWVYPRRVLTVSKPEDIEALFQSASSKPFRDQSFYHTVAAMQHLRIQSQDTNIDEP